MRHSLTQLLAASSGHGSPREPAAALSLPREEGGGGGSSAETGDEAEPMADDGGEDGGVLLFPAFELDAWLEAAAEEGGPDWSLGDPPAAPPSKPPAPGRLKAAEAARLNRQRKKQYVEGLERRLQGLAAENRQLRDRNRGLGRRLRQLEREAGYLRAVLANQSALGRLLSRLAGRGPPLPISTSLFWQEGQEEQQGQEEQEEEEEEEGEIGHRHPSGGGTSRDHDYALPVPREAAGQEDRPAPPSPGPAGLCLHVDRGQVSVEFCALCSRRAAGGGGSSPPPDFAAAM